MLRTRLKCVCGRPRLHLTAERVLVGVVYLNTTRDLYIFFFSSRRRHTRFDCDWSSDVCSSDLLANLGIDRERRPDAEAPERGVQTPEADAHPVLVPAPVRHGGKERHAGRRRERLSRHRTLDLPDFDIEDGPDDEPGIRRKAQGRPIDDGRISAAFDGFHARLQCTGYLKSTGRPYRPPLEDFTGRDTAASPDRSSPAPRARRPRTR